MGRDAIDAWLQYYQDQKNKPKTISPSERLTQYNESFLQKIVNQLAPRLRPGKPVRLWSAGSGIDQIALKLKTTYRDSVEITILDVSEDCISANRRAFEENGLESDFVVGDLFTTNYSGEFDIVFNSGLLEHFKMDEQEVLLRIFSDSLRPGGEYITYVPYAGGMLYTHCMERMKEKGAWQFGPETPIATLRGLQCGDMILVDEFPLDALYQMTFLRPAYPLLGLMLQPAISILMRFPGVFDPFFIRLFGGYGLFARFEKPLMTDNGTNSTQ